MITVKNLTKKYDDIVVVDKLNFTVKQGETLCFIGTSGCGKTTTLKMLNRLIQPTHGEIMLSGQNILEQEAISVRRQMGYVMQRGGLFPHWNVKRNISLVPFLLGWSPEKTAKRVDELLDLVNLDPNEYRDRFPAQLSGGQRQRVGIARAFAADPPVILMDEPFSALDPITRKQLQEKCLELKEKLKKTILFVTHDLEEAFLLADKIMIMDNGVMQQYDTSENIKNKPATEFVKKFLESHE
ncbi:ABC transporter ATP-binding protein [Candidatus Uabimicrobium sp. HlEnr_7]|uniref:ABC transporter ATP-binding protein n=1 Tax=Candidatus Uabimicrobium helgolandensis TaxID=3095367 RepID=UPI0035560EA5